MRRDSVVRINHESVADSSAAVVAAPDDGSTLVEDLVQGFDDEIAHITLVVLCRERAEAIAGKFGDVERYLFLQSCDCVTPPTTRQLEMQ